MGSSFSEHDRLQERLLRGLLILPGAGGSLLLAEIALPWRHAVVSRL